MCISIANNSALRNLFQEIPQDDTNSSGEASQPKKVGADPFNNEETDPTKSGAMRKYLIISNIFCLVTSLCNPQSVPRQKRQIVVMVLQIGHRSCSNARACAGGCLDSVGVVVRKDASGRSAGRDGPSVSAKNAPI